MDIAVPKSLRLLTLIVVASLAGCGGGGESTAPGAPPTSSSVSVPNVVGMPKVQAESTITAAGFVVGTETDFPTAQVPAGGVYSQTPAAGVSAAKGSAVNLLIATPQQLASSGTVQSDSGRSSFTYVSLALWANALSWDASNGVLQVVTGADSPAYPRSILSVDPTTGRVLLAHQLPIQALAVAVSADGQYVYAGLDMGGGIQRLNAKTLSLDLAIPVGASNTYIQAIAVSPVNPRTIAVAAWWLDGQYKPPGIAIFDDAVKRPNTLSSTVTVADPEDPYISINALTVAWGSDERTLYASPGLLIVDVTSQGASIRKWRKEFNSFGIGNRVRGNLVYSDGGEVFDLTGPVAQLGRFRYSNGNLQFRAELLDSGKSFAPVDHFGTSALGLPYVDGMTLHAADLNTFASIDSLTLTGIASATFGKLYAWGTDGLAWADQARLVIGRGTFTQRGALPTANVAAPLVASGDVATSSSGALSFRIYSTGASDILLDKCSNLYVSTYGNSQFNPDSIVALDPASGAVGFSAYAGSEPVAMAASDDCAYVYVGLDESTRISRINRTTRAIDKVIPLTSSTAGTFVKAQALASPPGFPGTVVASTKAGTRCFSGDVDVRVYDDGVLRPVAYVGVNPGYSVRDIVFGSSASTLYGYDTFDRDFQQSVEMFGLNASGMSQPTSLGLVTATILQDAARMLHFDPFSGRVFTQLGTVFDVRGNAAPIRMNLNSGAAVTGDRCGTPLQAVTTDPSTGKIFFVTWSPGGGFVLDTYSANGLSLLHSVSLTDRQLGGDAGIPQRLVRSGSNQLALVTSRGYLIHLQGELLAP